MPWSECPECWIPAHGETREHARRVAITYTVDDPRIAARLAAEKYAKADFRNDPFDRLSVRVRTDRGTFDVRVSVEMVPEFHAELPVEVP